MPNKSGPSRQHSLRREPIHPPLSDEEIAEWTEDLAHQCDISVCEEWTEMHAAQRRLLATIRQRDETIAARDRDIENIRKNAFAYVSQRDNALKTIASLRDQITALQGEVERLTAAIWELPRLREIAGRCDPVALLTEERRLARSEHELLMAEQDERIASLTRELSEAREQRP